MTSLSIVQLIGLTGLLTGVTTVAVCQPASSRADPRDPRKAHIWLALGDAQGPRTPDLQFYATRERSGLPAFRLSDLGVFVEDQPVCLWPDGAFEVATRIPAVLISASVHGESCAADVPVKSFAEADNRAVLYIEIARLNGSLVEIRYQGTPYYLSLRSLPGDPWQGTEGAQIVAAEASRPVIGGLDIPAIFRPRNGEARVAVSLWSSPRVDSSVVARLSSARLLNQFSLGSGTHVATVYARSNRWSLVGLIDGRTGWLAPADAGKFVTLERLVRREQTYMARGWDRTLARSPEDRERAPVPHDPRRSWIGYLAPREVTSGTVQVFATADRNQPPVATFEDETRALESVSPAGEGDRPIVFSRRPGWLEVGLRDSSTSYRREGVRHVWLEDPAGRWKVRPVDVSEADQLLSFAWGPEGSPAAEVTEMKRVGGILWLYVTVLVGEACEYSLAELPLVVLAQGWVPAHDSSGRPVVWFETYCD